MIFRIGYPCINLTLTCRSSQTMRLRSFSSELFLEKSRRNLECLEKILSWNLEHGLLFFRISSGLIPFASHPVNDVPWQQLLAPELSRIGSFIKKNGIRISMHPDQFIVLNSPSEDVLQRSLAELRYHRDLLDLLELGTDAKIQLHVGGAYGDRPAARRRFGQRFRDLPESLRERLVVENDDRLFGFTDCLEIHRECGIPVLVDTFHHELLNRGEEIVNVLRMAAATWQECDGPPMVDYSSQQAGSRPGTHAATIAPESFRQFAGLLSEIGCDLMLEIKDKEQSALRARQMLLEAGILAAT